MPINPSIPMSFRPPQVQQKDPIQQMAQIEQLKEYRRKSDTRNKLQQALQGSMGPDGAVDYSQVEKAYLQAGDPEGALKMRQGQASLSASQAKRKDSDLAVAQKRLKFFGNFGNVTDQATYDSLKAFGESTGLLEVGQLPDVYDPDTVMSIAKTSMDMKERLDQEYKGKRLGLEERRTAATEKTANAAAAGKLGTTVRFSQKEGDAYAKFLVDKDYGPVHEAASAAENLIGNLRIAKSIDVSTGAVEPLKAWSSALISSVGIDPETVGLSDASNAQAFQAITNRLVLAEMAAQKGPQTESDMKLIRTTVATLGNTPEARDIITETAFVTAERKLEKRDFYQNWQEKNGSFKGANTGWIKRERGFPRVGKNRNTGKLVFWHQFKTDAAQANPGATEQQLRDTWVRRYR